MITNIVTMIITNGIDPLTLSNEVANAVSKLPQHVINWTLIINSLIVSLTVMATILKLFSNKQTVKDETLRESKYIQEIKTENDNIKVNLEQYKRDNTSSFEQYKRDNSQLYQQINQQLTDIRLQLTRIDTKQINDAITTSEIKASYKDIITNLNDLTKAFLDYIST